MPTIDHVALPLADLGPGELRELSIAGHSILLARDRDRVFATSPTCPHYHLKLADGGTIADGCIRCPWHMSRFRASDGVVVEPPALDGLHSYPCRVDDDGNVVVTLPLIPESMTSVPPPMPRTAATSKKTVLVIGTGAAGYAAVQRLCELGFDGRVLMLGDDPTPLPYDRPSLSKAYFTGEKSAAKLAVREDAFFDAHAIERVRGRAVALDANAKTVHLADGQSLNYDGAILAVGGKPNSLDVPGGDLAGVLTLRSRVDCEQILGTLKRVKHAVVVGSSFIGMELAAGLRKKKIAVTVVSPSSTCFETALGAKVGRLFQKLHEAHGVAFRFGRKVARVEGAARAELVVLHSGETIECDVVIAGVGVTPATDWLRGSIPIAEDGGIEIDETMRVRGASDLFAVGDIARAPIHTGDVARIEHWRVAQQHGRRAAEVIAGADAGPIAEPPYFWSLHYDAGLDYVGHARGDDECRLDGDEAGDFFAEYVRDGRVVAIASVGRTERVMRTIEAMRSGSLSPCGRGLG